MELKSITVYLVEDDPDDQYLLKLMLQKDPQFDYRVHCFARLSECLASSDEETPDLILLDLILPDSMGEETLVAVLDNYRHTPVIVLTGVDQGDIGERAVGIGAQDYLRKIELSQTALGQSIRYALERHSLVKELHHRAITDYLTGLLNRSAFIERLDHELAHAERYKHMFAVASIDLDDFKQVNDTLGHGVGDQVLIKFGQILEQCTRRSDTPARFGGDEFVVLLTRLESVKDAQEIVAQKHKELIAALDDYVNHLVGDKVELGISIGVAIYPSDGASVDQLLIAADKALYKSKRAGKNTFYLTGND